MSDSKGLLIGYIQLHNMIEGNEDNQVPIPVNRDGKEYHVVPDRRWRFDYAYPQWMIGIEIHGGVWVQGGHTRGSGFIKDREKFNRAALAGWLVLEFPIITTDTLPHDCVQQIAAAIEMRKREKSISCGHDGAIGYPILGRVVYMCNSCGQENLSKCGIIWEAGLKGTATR